MDGLQRLSPLLGVQGAKPPGGFRHAPAKAGGEALRSTRSELVHWLRALYTDLVGHAVWRAADWHSRRGAPRRGLRLARRAGTATDLDESRIDDSRGLRDLACGIRVDRKQLDQLPPWLFRRAKRLMTEA